MLEEAVHLSEFDESFETPKVETLENESTKPPASPVPLSEAPAYPSLVFPNMPSTDEITQVQAGSLETYQMIKQGTGSAHIKKTQPVPLLKLDVNLPLPLFQNKNQRKRPHSKSSKRAKQIRWKHTSQQVQTRPPRLFQLAYVHWKKSIQSSNTMPPHNRRIHPRKVPHRKPLLPVPLAKLEEKLIPQETNWLHDLTQDGDVESNPGPIMHMSIVWIFALHLINQISLAIDPMLCQAHEGKKVFSLPKSPSCQNLVAKDILDIHQLQNADVQLMRRNTIKYQSDAYACKKIQTKVRSFTYFFNDENLREVQKEQVPVSADECTRMQKFQKSNEGELTFKGDLWRTNNQPDWSYPGGGIHCCYWKESISTNAYLYKVTVYKQHHLQEMESTIGDVGHCDYNQGQCQLQDGTFLLWTPNQDEKCEYIPWKKMSGQTFGNSWLSQDGNLALTHENKKTTRNCNGEPLILSDQGIAFQYIPTSQPSQVNPQYKQTKAMRIKRDQPLSGPVPSEVLAASLQALSFDIRKSTQFAFNQAMSATCRAMNTIIEIIKTSIVSNPTLTMRAILKQQYIWSRSGGSVIEVWPCNPLKEGTYNYLAMNSSCTNGIPIEFTINGQIHHGYMDPKTNIIDNHAAPIDCNLVEEIPLQSQETISLYQSKTGFLRPVTNITKLNLIQWNSTEILPTQPTIFHEIVMYNWTEVSTHISLNRLLSSISAQEKIFSELGVTDHEDPRAAARQAIQNIFAQGLFNFFSGLSLSLWQIWVFCCCLIVTLKVLFSFCTPTELQRRLNFNLPGVIQPYWQKLKTRPTPIPEPQPISAVSSSINLIPNPPTYDETLHESQLGIDFAQQIVHMRPTIPDRGALMSDRNRPQTFYLCAGAIEPVFHPTTPLVEINLAGIPLTALIDTGSPITLISERVAQQMEEAQWRPTANSVKSLTGHSLKLMATTQAPLTIGATTVMANCTVQQNAPVDCILGTSVLRLLGEITLNFTKRTVQIHEHPTYFVAIPHCNPPPLENIEEDSEPELSWEDIYTAPEEDSNEIFETPRTSTPILETPPIITPILEKQRERESVHSYNERITKSTENNHTWFDRRGNLYLHIFMEGLTPELRDSVAIYQPVDHQEAYGLAVHTQSQNHRISHPKCKIYPHCYDSGRPDQLHAIAAQSKCCTDCEHNARETCQYDSSSDDSFWSAALFLTSESPIIDLTGESAEEQTSPIIDLTELSDAESELEQDTQPLIIDLTEESTEPMKPETSSDANSDVET